MQIFGGYNDSLKPKRQAFLLSKDENSAHFISEISTLQLPKAAGFTLDQSVIDNGKVIALADQYSLRENSLVKNHKNIFIFENNKWAVKKLN